MPEPIPSAIYARVSPTTHVKTPEGVHQSIQESIRICQEAAERDGNPVVKIYIDEYVSGKSSKDMPEFQKMLKEGLSGEWKRLYLRRVNRFGRTWHGSAKAASELIEAGISIKFVEEGVDTLNPLGKGIMSFFFDIAEKDRLDILENTKRGRERAKIKGTRSGKPWGHPKKDVNIKSIRQLRLMPVNERPTWKQLSKDYNISISGMIKRLKDAGYWDKERRCVK